MHHRLKALPLATLTALALLSIALIPSAAGASRWHLVKSRTVRGNVRLEPDPRVGLTREVSAAVRHPRGIAVDLTNAKSNAVAVVIWGCVPTRRPRAFHHVLRAGHYVLPHVAGASLCRVYVDVSVFGQAQRTVRILAR